VTAQNKIFFEAVVEHVQEKREKGLLFLGNQSLFFNLCIIWTHRACAPATKELERGTTDQNIFTENTLKRIE